MHCKHFFTLTLSLFIVLALAVPGMTAQTFQFKMAHIGTKGDAGETALQYLKKILEEKSGGRIKAMVYMGKSMAQSDTELGEIVRQGTVQLVPIPTHTLSAMANIPQYSIFEFPYLFTDWEEIYKVLDSDLAKEWSKVLERDAGVVVYDGFVKGWLSIGTKKGPINTPADLKGLKIRTMATDMQMGLVSALGASPTVVAYGELYTAQQQGTVDGMLTATTLYKTDKFCEVIDHLAIIRATAHFHLPTVNKQWVDSLPADLRAIFDECMKDFVRQGREIEKKLNAEVMVSLETKDNVKVRQYTEAELAPFKAAVKSMWEKNYDRPGKGVLDSVIALLGKDYKTLLQ
ncbi:putative TRAP-T type transporter subunit DctP [uncultured delta proteobacterium]|uniref:Putative TRAP-T type transporter subunit DctP n=1 Tax=uncultured delta proteobacterium TaxID=34034 RepID=A0A212JXX8_9DELT|nr:putative TRAP-T type transporter subunit DctP [uncultured delta proteobacterium]